MKPKSTCIVTVRTLFFKSHEINIVKQYYFRLIKISIQFVTVNLTYKVQNIQNIRTCLVNETEC